MSLIAPLRLALAQINPRVGDIEGNAAKITEYIADARDAGAELVLFPELAVTGYPPEDLLLKEHFLQATPEAVAELAAEARGDRRARRLPGARRRRLQRARPCSPTARCRPSTARRVLPNYGVFDEQRYFQVGEGGAVLELGDARLGLTICEDIWTPGPPASDEALAGAALILNASASPYHARQGRRARADARSSARATTCGGRVLQPRRRPGRAGLRRPLARCSTTRACVLARAPQFARGAAWSRTVDLQAALTRAAARHAAAPAACGARCPRCAGSDRWRGASDAGDARPAAT